jgi:hypothetical protein
MQEAYWEIEFANVNPSVDFGKGYIQLKKRTPEECFDNKSGIFAHAPIHALDTRSTESWAGQKHKLRPSVIISEAIDFNTLGERATRKAGRSFPPCFLCAPIYSLQDGNGKYKPHFRHSFINHLKLYKLPMAFHLAAEHGLKESCVRLDRIQPVAEEFMKPFKKGLRLSEECLMIFDECLTNFLFRIPLKHDSLIREYQKKMGESAVAQPATPV